LDRQSTKYIKTKWEEEAKIALTDEDWKQICTSQWRTTGSHVWREFCWKNVTRFFITPCQSVHYSQGGAECWRKCGNQEANHYHVFWDCHIIRKYWTETNNAMQIVFNFGIMYLGLEPPTMDTREDYLWNILLAAGKKALTQKWTGQISQQTCAKWNK